MKRIVTIVLLATACGDDVSPTLVDARGWDGGGPRWCSDSYCPDGWPDAGCVHPHAKGKGKGLTKCRD